MTVPQKGTGIVTLACSICFGDPHSLLSKGAKMGVLFLVGVVYLLLGSIALTVLVWWHRSRKLKSS